MVKFSDGSQCILAGDFNTQPDMPLYKMITSGTVCDDTINILLSSNHYIDSKVLIDEKVCIIFHKAYQSNWTIYMDIKGFKALD